MTEYSFVKLCNPEKLTIEIGNSSLTGLDRIETASGTKVFFSSALSGADETILNDLIDDHVNEPIADIQVPGLILTGAAIMQLASDDKARAIAHDLTAAFKVLNQSNSISLAQSLWAHHRLRSVVIVVNQDLVDAIAHFAPLLGQTITIDALNLVITGDIETAYFVFATMTPDDMTEDFHVLDTTALGFMRSSLGKYLGWE
jgi:hypothetical protein